ERAIGAIVRFAGPATLAAGDGVRLDFESWEGAPDGTLTAVAGTRKVTARYRTSYQLSLRVSPAEGGSWRISPSSADGFYAAGTSVSVGVDAAKGYSFHQWGGDLAGVSSPMPLVMSA